MPETIQILTFAGRNYMFPILAMSIFGVLLVDEAKGNPLSKEKFFLLTILIACFATWRSEGILIIPFLPFMVYFTYFNGKRLKEIFELSKVLKGTLIFVLIFLVFYLPGKYGAEKYQGKDYFIINLPGPLAAVWLDEEANLDYSGYATDEEKVTSVVPKDYILKYGETATSAYNIDCVRFSRQTAAGEAGDDFVTGAYSILLHNWQIYLKYEFNNFFKSLGCKELFETKVNSSYSVITPQSEEAADFRQFWSAYYTVGANDLMNSNKILIINDKITGKLQYLASGVLNLWYVIEFKWTGYLKLVIALFTLNLVLYSAITRQWFMFFIGASIISFLAAIILCAPAVRSNYYYYPYLLQYIYIAFWILRAESNKKIVSVNQ